MFIQVDVDVANQDEPFSREELNTMKMELSELKNLVETLLNNSNQQLSSPIKRKGNDDSKGKQSLALKIKRIDLIWHIIFFNLI